MRLEQSAWTAEYSIHMLSGEPWVQALLFGCSALLAASLVAGYRTRLVAALSLVLLVSVQFRNPLVLNGADRLFRELLVLALFLPLGKRWAIDAQSRAASDDEDEDEDEDTDERTIDTDDTDEPAARTDGTTAERSDRGTGGTAAGGADDGNDGAIVSADDGTLPPSLIATPATAAALLYAVTLFFNNATLKRDGDTWTDGEALLYALRQDHMTILLGNHLAESPALLEVGSYVWFGLLVASPLLLVLSGPVRLAYAGVFLVTVAGMSVSMAVGLFPALLAALLLLFLPTPVWDTLERAGTTALGRLGVRADLRAAARRIDGPRRLRSEAPRVGVSNRQ